ncbi:MAG: NAD-dependent epimerase/dehydratase family protein [Planctomycetes bacterium]|nr:NAD-dependent epimerase/dehydratase family protein [Planctomycetota bacterium]
MAMNLVTGATGLLGSHICEQLVRLGQPVRALVRNGSDSSFLESIGVEVVRGDITTPDSLPAAMSGVDIVYHAAAKVGDWGPWQEFVTATITGTANVLAAARDAGVSRFLHVSSISAYGRPADGVVALDETAPLGQNLHRWSYYSRAKIEAERLVWATHNAGQMAVTVCRPSWLYGPRDRASIPRLIRAIEAGKAVLAGDGENRLNLTYAGNEAEGCILAANYPGAVGEVYNLSSDGLITQSEYLNKIATALGAKPVTKKVPYKLVYKVAFAMELLGRAFGRKTPPLATRYAIWLMGRRCYFSCEKARTQLNWQPTVGYDEGIEKAVAWYRSTCG